MASALESGEMDKSTPRTTLIFMVNSLCRPVGISTLIYLGLLAPWETPVRAGRVALFQFLYPHPNSHAFLLQKLANELAHRGHDVLVRTGSDLAQLGDFTIAVCPCFLEACHNVEILTCSTLKLLLLKTNSMHGPHAPPPPPPHP